VQNRPGPMEQVVEAATSRQGGSSEVGGKLRHGMVLQRMVPLLSRKTGATYAKGTEPEGLERSKGQEAKNCRIRSASLFDKTRQPMPTLLLWTCPYQILASVARTM
jgi:hypothetical protein